MSGILPTAPAHFVVRPYLFIDAQHGLGNRLRAIASAASIAYVTDRQLAVIWEPDHHCRAQLSDLIDFDEPVLPSGEGVRDLMRKRSLKTYNYMEVEPGALFEEPILADRAILPGDIYVRSAYSLKSPHSDPIIENRFLRSLRPAQAVCEMVAAVDHPSDVAMHIRMATGPAFNHLAHEAPSNWPPARHVELLDWRSKSHISQFVARLDQIIEERGKQSVFVAADLLETYSALSDR